MTYYEKVKAECGEGLPETSAQEAVSVFDIYLKGQNAITKSCIQEIAEAMQWCSIGKQKLVTRIAVKILKSDLFNQGYEKGTDPEKIKTTLRLVLSRNQVSVEDGKRVLMELAEVYNGKRLHSPNPSGQSKSEQSQSNH